MKRMLWGILLLVLASTSAQAALHSCLSGQACYDDVLNITWLADANAGAGSIYDDGVNTTDGRMTWASAQAWIGSLNASSYLGISNWRLPTVTDTGTSGCNFAYTGTDCGYNVDLSTGEMAHMFYSTLGNSAAFNTSGVFQPCGSTPPNYCLTSTSPFSNLQPGFYWSGTAYTPSTSYAWFFRFDRGQQANAFKTDTSYAWAVRPGDSPLEAPPVPVPGAVWLLSGALAALGAVRLRAKSIR